MGRTGAGLIGRLSISGTRMLPESPLPADIEASLGGAKSTGLLYINAPAA